MTQYYKIINIPELDKISHEVDVALGQLVTGAPDLKEVYTFNIINTTQLLDLAPSLAKWLDAVGLRYNLLYAGLPCTAPHSNGSIHTDGKCTESINLPVYNCNDGYSVWYDAIQIGGIAESTSGKSTNQAAEYVPYSHAGAVELARISNKHPIWFNTAVPHRGVNFSGRPRIILTLRFNCPINIDTL
jgi:hypothetical protein